MKSSTGNGEFILENSTKNINGFLYNRGNGRTEFRRALLKVNDSTYILGADTLLLKNQLRTTDNNLSILGSTIDTRKTPYTINYAASVVYDAQNGYNQRLVLSGNVTAFTFSHTQGGDYLALNVIQDATGGRTIIWPSAIKWKGGIAPTLTTTGNAVDKIMFYYNSDSGFYEGVYGLDFK